MKNFNFSKILAMLVIGLVLIASCKKDEGTTTPVYAIPTISIISPDIPTDGLKTEAGSTIKFSIKVDAEAGLSTLSLDDNVIKTYTGTETSDTVEYDYLALEAGTKTLSFVVEDAASKLADIDVSLIIEEGEDLGYLLLDFAGSLTSTEDKEVVDWDLRKLFAFDVSGSHGTTASAEVVHTQAQLLFAESNPDVTDDAKVLKVVKTVPDGYDNWGGWAHIIFGLKSVIAEDIITALPTWNATDVVTVPGTKVIKLDAYYDATVDPNFTWDTLMALTDIWNSEPSKGYKFDIALASYDPMGIAESGHDGAVYMAYSAYISEPNKWVTVTFNLADEGRTDGFYGINADSPGPAVIDCVKLLPAGGYAGTDLNPLYLKNLRIVDVTE